MIWCCFSRGRHEISYTYVHAIVILHRRLLHPRTFGLRVVAFNGLSIENSWTAESEHDCARASLPIESDRGSNVAWKRSRATSYKCVVHALRHSHIYARRSAESRDWCGELLCFASWISVNFAPRLTEWLSEWVPRFVYWRSLPPGKTNSPTRYMRDGRSTAACIRVYSLVRSIARPILWAGLRKASYLVDMLHAHSDNEQIKRTKQSKYFTYRSIERSIDSCETMIFHKFYFLININYITRIFFSELFDQTCPISFWSSCRVNETPIMFVTLALSILVWWTTRN